MKTIITDAEKNSPTEGQCTARGCPCIPRPLPIILEFLGTPLCDHHIAYLVDAYEAAHLLYHEDGFAAQAALREAQNMLYGSSRPALRLIRGKNG